MKGASTATAARQSAALFPDASHRRFPKCRYAGWVTLTLCLLISGFCRRTLGQNFTLDWFKVAGGGGTSVAGTYVLSGTFGQPDAGLMTVGQYTLQGGFWPGIDAGGLLLTIKVVGTNVTLTWPTDFSGYVLEQTPKLAPPTWTIVPQTPINNGAYYSVTLSRTAASMFYRLAQESTPRLLITRSGNSVLLTWPSPSTGFALQQTTSLKPVNWTNAPQTATDDGIIKSVTVSPATGNVYYRLKQ
jgi:hypothetical protein